MHILIVDDAADIRDYLRLLLEDIGCHVLEATNGQEALQIVTDIEENPIDLILMDIVMPGIDGIETVSRLRRLHPKHWIPIIYLSAKAEEELVCKALEEGGDDYITKPFSPNLLIAKIHSFLRVKNLQQELESMNVELFHNSITDPLTQIHNRLGFLNQYEVQWRISAREQNPMSVIMIDVDYFKEFNDWYGHLEGDRCLHDIAQALLNALKRPGDLLGRFGGEEFIAMLPSTGVEGALRVGEDMRQAVSALQIENAKNNPHPYISVSVSVGVSTCDQIRMCRSEDLIRAADEALYAAKHAGRDRTCFAGCLTGEKPQQERASRASDKRTSNTDTPESDDNAPQGE